MPETSIRVAIRGLGLSLLLVLPAAHADEPPCPSSAPAATAPEHAAAPPDPDAPITIESDDKDFEFDVDGNARLCGNVEMKQGDRTIRADCLEYNSKTQDATLKGGTKIRAIRLVELSCPSRGFLGMLASRCCPDRPARPSGEVGRIIPYCRFPAGAE